MYQAPSASHLSLKLMTISNLLNCHVDEQSDIWTVTFSLEINKIFLFKTFPKENLMWFFGFFKSSNFHNRFYDFNLDKVSCLKWRPVRVRSYKKYHQKSYLHLWKANLILVYALPHSKIHVCILDFFTFLRELKCRPSLSFWERKPLLLLFNTYLNFELL